MNYRVQDIALTDIFILPGRREVKMEAVESLADSIRMVGLQEPIKLRYNETYVDPEEGEIGGALTLITGGHRLAAARLLGWSEIPASVLKITERQARMIEIAENLHRNDLTRLQRDEQMSEWIQLAIEEEGQVSAQVAPKPSGGRPESGIRLAARQLNVTKDQARRAREVAGLSEPAKAIARETGQDNNQSALLEAKKVGDGDAGAEVVYLRQRHEAHEAEKKRKQKEKANRDADRVVEMTDAHRAALMIHERFALDEVASLLLHLESCKMKDLTKSIRRIMAGEDDERRSA